MQSTRRIGITKKRSTTNTERRRRGTKNRNTERKRKRGSAKRNGTGRKIGEDESVNRCEKFDLNLDNIFLIESYSLINRLIFLFLNCNFYSTTIIFT